MKNLFTLLMALCLSVVAVAQEPVQRSLITKRTATWCSNCGNWGWAFMEGLMEDNGDKATYIGAHYSGDLQTDPGIAFTDQFGGSGQPNFFFGENKLSVGSSSYPTQQIMLKQLIDEASAIAPIANTAILEGDTADGKIEMTARTQFYQEAEGEFYLSILLLEDGVVNNQAGQGPNAVHKNVLRGSATQSVFGDALASGAIEKDASFLTPFSIDLDPSWNVNSLTLAFIIWNKVGNEYTFVNTYSTNEIFSVVSSTRLQLSKDAYTLNTNLIPESAQLVIGNNGVYGEAIVQLIDMQGRLIETIWNERINAAQTMQIENNGHAAGTYMIKIQINNKTATERVVFLH